MAIKFGSLFPSSRSWMLRVCIMLEGKKKPRGGRDSQVGAVGPWLSGGCFQGRLLDAHLIKKKGGSQKLWQGNLGPCARRYDDLGATCSGSTEARSGGDVTKDVAELRSQEAEHVLSGTDTTSDAERGGEVDVNVSDQRRWCEVLHGDDPESVEAWCHAQLASERAVDHVTRQL
ncbi:uncharacterized protein LOC144098811 isoform X2 [Amblyomma americanum]